MQSILQTFQPACSILVYWCTLAMLIAGTLIFVLLNKINNGKRTSALDLQLELAQINTREQIIRRISDELHDKVGQLLNSANLLLGVCERSLADPPELLFTIQETLGVATKEVRTLSRILQEDWLDSFDLNEFIRQDAERISKIEKLEVRTDLTVKILPFGAKKQVLIYTTIFGIVSNIVRYANASQLAIQTLMRDGFLIVNLTDNGIPYNNGSKNDYALMKAWDMVYVLKGSMYRRLDESLLNNITLTIPVR